MVISVDSGTKPYSKEELRSIVLYVMPHHPSWNCDWCGKPYESLHRGHSEPRICSRCWANRQQISDEIDRLTVSLGDHDYPDRLEKARINALKEQSEGTL